MRIESRHQSLTNRKTTFINLFSSILERKYIDGIIIAEISYSIKPMGTASSSRTTISIIKNIFKLATFTELLVQDS